MSLVGRTRRRISASASPVGSGIKFNIDLPTLPTPSESRAFRLALVCAAFSALAACQQSSSGQANLSGPSSGTAAPVVTLVAMKASIVAGTAATLQWSATDAQSCTASGGWSGSQPTSGSVTTDPLTATTQYTLTCAGPAGSASQSAEVIVTSAAPTLTLAASPPTVAKGGTSTLNWNSENATACTASGGWSGVVATSGTWSTGTLANTTDYALTCTGSDGTTATQSVIVTVSGLAPVVALSVNPSTVNSGTAATLTWSAQNAAACAASGAWSGTKALSGSQSTGAPTANATYTLTCTGAGGSATQSATVSVKSPTPAVSILAAPSTVTSGTSATLSWNANNAASCSASGAWSGREPVSGSRSTGILSADKTYVLTCSGPGGTAVQSATVSVKSRAPTVSLSVGPSAITSGSSATLNWSATNATACTASGAWSGTKAFSGSQSTGALSANATYTLTCTGAGGSAAQTATVSVSSHPTVTVAFNASPSTVASGSASTLTWSSANATSCTASGGWSGSKSISGSQSSGSLTADTIYTLTCTGTGGSATQSATVSVTPSAPTVTLTASPSTVASGSASSLSWSATHATACTASGAWSGSKPVNGSQSTGALTANATYGLTCTGTGGHATQSATVSVTSPAPMVSLSATPSAVASGGSSTLTWTATNATICTASGPWSGSKAVSGSQSTGALTANATYGLTCTGTGGSATQSASVSIAQAAPAVTFSANPSTVKSGTASTLTWSSSNATSCTASGGWTGSEPTSGSDTTSSLAATTKFTMTCSGAGGSASQSATITVTTAASGKATLSWAAPVLNTDGTPVAALAGYRIYYGTSAVALTQSVAVSGATVTSYEITGLAPGTWYFAVAADAADGAESAQSSVGSKTI